MTVDVNALKRVRDHLGVDLGQPFQPPDDPVLYRICRDPILAVDVLYCVVKPQADERDMSSWDFGSALAGGTVRQAIDALMAGLVNFFQNLGRTDAAEGLPKLRELYSSLVAEAGSEVKAMDPEEMVKKLLEMSQGET